jgi:hypothetical protein
MGIKFLCPNGHKLHVKSFLSGRRAICPKCGARLVVPVIQDRESATEQDFGLAGEESPSIVLNADVSTESPTASTPASVLESAAAPVLVPPDATAVPAAPPDAIDEAPGAVWYVRPATGGQFGPASAAIMRSWIDEGRIGASSLVWRAGWPEWRLAAATFPQLGALLATPGVAFPQTQLAANGQQALRSVLPVGQVVKGPNSGETTANLPSDVPPVAVVIRRRRAGNDLNLIASIVLILISIILVIVLILVFRWQGAPPDESQAPSQIRMAHVTDLQAALVRR